MPWFVSNNQVVLTPGLGDKGILPPQFIRSVFEAKTRKLIYQQPIEFLCIYDFECNCSKNHNEIAFNEIIEFPVVIVDLKQKCIKDVFQTYVRPTIEAQVTPFCTELTHITNEMVFKEGTPTIEQALGLVHEFLMKNEMFKHEFVFASCGDFDGK